MNRFLTLTLRCGAVVVALLVCGGANARCYRCEHRNREAVREFKSEHPCPATGQSKGRCPGYVVDHIDPLCHGGADEPWNMQWQTREEAKLKDREERRMCRP